MDLTIKAAGKEFTFRKLTEEEASKIADKKIVALNDTTHDLMDDGDEEILQLLTSPSKEEARAVLQKHGQFLDQVFFKLMVFFGNQIPQEDLTIDEAKLSLEHKCQVIGVKWRKSDGSFETVLFRRLSYADTKIIKREMGEQGMLLNKMLLPRAKALCLEKEKGESLSSEQPFFFVNIGKFLWDQTSLKIEDEQKK